MYLKLKHETKTDKHELLDSWRLTSSRQKVSSKPEATQHKHQRHKLTDLQVFIPASLSQSPNSLRLRPLSPSLLLRVIGTIISLSPLSPIIP